MFIATNRFLLSAFYGLILNLLCKIMWQERFGAMTVFKTLKNIRFILDAVGSSRILIGKQKIGLTFNSDKPGGNDFTKFSKLTMCSA